MHPRWHSTLLAQFMVTVSFERRFSDATDRRKRFGGWRGTEIVHRFLGLGSLDREQTDQARTSLVTSLDAQGLPLSRNSSMPIRGAFRNKTHISKGRHIVSTKRHHKESKPGEDGCECSAQTSTVWRLMQRTELVSFHTGHHCCKRSPQASPLVPDPTSICGDSVGDPCARHEST